ncbi:hypothetical protein MANES_01G082850v8 [Manihot esculenta]|uniref:Uncharacterized protein n=1 Tax=Manihot esculenta TaxID=3983 RepID=A0ACB7IEF9_MANES|nr:hypothetical protein MANES_01G082850v8 [Manihot esculenta]
MVHVIMEGPDKGNRKNKHESRDFEVRFDFVDKVVGFFQNDPLVIKILLNRYEVRQVLMDIGNSVNLLILNVFNKLDLDKNNITRVFYPLVGLRDKIVAVLSTINLPLVLGDERYRREIYAEFAVVDIPFAYNVILGHPILNCHGVIINMGAMYLKLLAPRDIAVV